MEIDLPTPITHPPSCGTHLCSLVALPPTKYACKYMKMDVCKSKRKNLNYLSVYLSKELNGIAHIRHKWRKTMVLSCYRCLINSGAEKNELHLNIG
jgi:hypothetical protein